MPVAAAVVLLALSGCGRTDNAQPAAATPPDATQAAAAQAEADKAAQQARAAELAAKEKKLADREAALKQKEVEAELARREAEAAAAKAAKTAKAKATAAKPAPAKVAAAAPAAAAAKEAPKPPPKPILVPAGTQLAIELTSAVTTKTAQAGDPVQGRLSLDVIVDGRVAARAGAPVTGAVTKVVSGSKKVGGTPTLGLSFKELVVSSGATAPIDAGFVQEGKNDTPSDTAKILGGAAAGAIIGNQVSHNGGSVIGGLLGGAAGTAVAYGTGGEVSIAAGTVVNVVTGTSFEVRLP